MENKSRKKDKVSEIEKLATFSNLESRLLIELAEKTRMTPSECAQFLNVPRTTIYNFLKRLEKRGILKQVISDGKKYITLVSKEELSRIGDQESESIKSSFDLLGQLVSKNDSQYSHFFNSRLEVFSDNSGVEKVLFGLLQSKSKKVRFIIKDHANLNLLNKKLSGELIDLRVRRDISSEVLVPKSALTPPESIFSEHKKYKREVKVLPKDFTLGTNIVMYDETVGFITLGNQAMCFRVVDKAFFDTMNSFFENLWK